MAVNFCVLLCPMETFDKTSDAVVKAIVILYNYLLYCFISKYYPSRFAIKKNKIKRRHIESFKQATNVICRKGASNYASRASYICDKYLNLF
jgi:hypothetical protein